MLYLRLAVLIGLLAAPAAAEQLSEAKVRALARPGAVWCYWPLEGPGCVTADLIGPRKGAGFVATTHFALDLVVEPGGLARRIAAQRVDYVFEDGKLCETAAPDPARAIVYVDGEGPLRPRPEGRPPTAAEIARIAAIYAEAGPDRICLTYEEAGPSPLGPLYLQFAWSGGARQEEGDYLIVLPPGSTVRLDVE